MWEIYEHRRVSKQLKGTPQEVLKRYEKWKDIVRLSGPAGLGMIKGFHDEALRGEWVGHRSSRLGLQYCVVYKVLKDRVMIQVVNLTPHDYRKK
jgi:proteic killer suppression protein